MGNAMSSSAPFPEAGQCHASSRPSSQGGSVSSLTFFAGREWSQLWQHPISQTPKMTSPRWLLAMLADISMRVCWASAVSTRGEYVKPKTHLCHRTCQPSRCDRCTAKAGGTSREDTLAYARTPRSTPPPSLGRTCRRTGHSSIIKSKQELQKSWLCAVQGSHRHSGAWKPSQRPYGPLSSLFHR